MTAEDQMNMADKIADAMKKMRDVKNILIGVAPSAFTVIDSFIDDDDLRNIVVGVISRIVKLSKPVYLEYHNFRFNLFMNDVQFLVEHYKITPQEAAAMVAPLHQPRPINFVFPKV